MSQEKQRIIVRPLVHDDVEHYLDMFSPVVREILHVSCVEIERAYLLERLQQVDAISFYAIISQNKDHLIGAIDIRNPDAYRGQLYCWIHESYWGTGIFHDAMRLATSDYFKRVNARYFNALVDVHNIRSYCALKKFGFADSGYMHGAYGRQYELILREKMWGNE
jgi:RimJ/RimL family protein N-acetyltransferase